MGSLRGVPAYGQLLLVRHAGGRRSAERGPVLRRGRERDAKAQKSRIPSRDSYGAVPGSKTAPVSRVGMPVHARSSLAWENAGSPMRPLILVLLAATMYGQPDPAEAGRELFAGACGPCHGPNGEGGHGPGLADGRRVRRLSDEQ